MVNLNECKIDMVYTWVNSNDYSWQKKKNSFLPECKNVNINSECRYIDNDELKYSLRSLEKYASWINKVYVVTDEQIPEWLNTDNEKIRIIDHKEIIPEKYLPVFNSNAIEHCISNIPELSEFYLYGNDDMCFANYVTPDFFFSRDGYPYCRYSRKYDKHSNSYAEMCSKTDDLIEKRFGKAFRMFAHHNINAFRKSDVKKCSEVFHKEIEATIASRFRNVDNVEQTIYLSHAVFTGHGHYKGICRLDMHLPIYKNKMYNYFSKKYKFDTLYINPEDTNLFEELKNDKNIKLFCINDGENVTKEQREYAKQFLQEYFPQRSSFEK